MKTQTRSLLTLVCVASASLLITASPSQAGYLVTLDQVGSNVVANGSGPIDLTGLTKNITAVFGPGIIPNSPFILTSPQPAVSEDTYRGSFTGPMSFGGGGATSNTSGSGDGVGFGNLIYVPAGYVSGNPLSDSMTFNGATLAGLGVTAGTYEWTWGTGVNQNFTLQVGPATVPDTGSTLGLLALALAVLLGASRLRSIRLA